MRKNIDRDAPFQSVRGAAYLSGFSTGYIRTGCREGNIPCVKVGTDFRINMPLWLAQLNEQSAANAHGGD